MHLKKLLLFLLGYIVVMVEGPIEKFINSSINKGVNLQNLKSLSTTKIQFEIPLRDFWKIHSIVKQTDYKVKIIDKRGFPFFWNKTKKRKLLIIGIIAFVISMYTLSNLIWFVDVYSHENLVYLEKHEIIEIAEKSGLRTGIFKNSIDLKKVEHEILSQTPEISWVGVKFQGTRAIIEVVERKLLDEEHMDKGPKHLVAAKGGVIQEILVMVGQPFVQIGDTVQTGQILISGMVSPQGVTARGIVRAKVWYKGQGSAELEETIKRRTGVIQRVYYLNLPDRKVILRGSLDSRFENYETETNITRPPRLPYIQISGEIVRVTYYEINLETRTYQREEVIPLIKDKLIESFNIPPEAKIVDQEIQLLLDTDQEIVIKLIIEVIEDIAKLSPID